MACLLAACGGEGADTASEALVPDTTSAAVVNDTIPPPVADGEPMPAARDASGIPPYPGAVVRMVNAAPASTYRVNAFTPDPMERVVAFYQESLPGWRMVRTRNDIVVFQKEPDQAAITISDWDASKLGPGAAEVLRGARTVIGTAWR
ncbi:MAG: hypothetical protein ACRELU_09095 [Gemmatimonadota bacterium]